MTVSGGAGHEGVLLIADITGYTAYLNDSELEHAQSTLTDLLNVLIDQTRPPLVVSQLEGDAVLSHGAAETLVRGQTFVEMIEGIYVEFRRAIELMVLNTTCQCNACANIGSLDLKFFVHHGRFAFQRVGDTDQLVGSDVNLVHRLLKNTVAAETGITAYLVLTEVAVDRLGLHHIVEGVAHAEDLADFGRVRTTVVDMHPVWEARKGEAAMVFQPGEVYGELSTDIALPPEVVWDFAARPEFRHHLTMADRTELDSSAARVGVGSEYVCWHGQAAARQAVVEWRPFERMVVRQTLPMPGRKPAWVHLDFRFEPIEGGTRLRQLTARRGGPRSKQALAAMFVRLNNKKAQASLDAFRDLVEASAASAASGHERP